MIDCLQLHHFIFTLAHLYSTKLSVNVHMYCTVDILLYYICGYTFFNIAIFPEEKIELFSGTGINIIADSVLEAILHRANNMLFWIH